MKIKIIAVGKLPTREKLFLESKIKKLSREIKLEMIEINDESDRDLNRAITLESQKILEKIDKKETIVLLDLGGKASLSSIKFNKNDCITFIIGGSNGVNENVRKLSNYSVSLSKLTFPHRLARYILIDHIISRT